MVTTDFLQSVQFVVDRRGKRTAAILNIADWEALVNLLEDLEDAEIVQERLKGWRSKEGWTAWETFEAELEATDELSAVG